jgi:hypothetical protein
LRETSSSISETVKVLVDCVEVQETVCEAFGECVPEKLSVTPTAENENEVDSVAEAENETVEVGRDREGEKLGLPESCVAELSQVGENDRVRETVFDISDEDFDVETVVSCEVDATTDDDGVVDNAAVPVEESEADRDTVADDVPLRQAVSVAESERPGPEKVAEKLSVPDCVSRRQGRTVKLAGYDAIASISRPWKRLHRASQREPAGASATEIPRGIIPPPAMLTEQLTKNTSKEESLRIARLDEGERRQSTVLLTVKLAKTALEPPSMMSTCSTARTAAR